MVRVTLIYPSVWPRVGVRGVVINGLHSYGTAAKEHPKLLYNSTAFFLVMAIADNALFGIESLKDLQAFEIPVGEEELILTFKESALERPILR